MTWLRILDLALFRDCFPELLELDLSHSRLSGTIPADLGRGIPKIEQIKLEDNDLTGKAQYTKSNGALDHMNVCFTSLDAT